MPSPSFRGRLAGIRGGDPQATTKQRLLSGPHQKKGGQIEERMTAFLGDSWFQLPVGPPTPPRLVGAVSRGGGGVPCPHCTRLGCCPGDATVPPASVAKTTATCPDLSPDMKTLSCSLQGLSLPRVALHLCQVHFLFILQNITLFSLSVDKKIPHV